MTAVSAVSYTVRCLDCPKSAEVTWLPMLWDAGHACAESSVAKHLEVFPTHRCTVLPEEP